MLSIDAWLDEKPYREVYDGVIHQKVSPQLAHAIVASYLPEYSGAGRGRGAVSVELRVYLAPGVTLVPDVCFISHGRFAAVRPEAGRTPPFAPDITIEVRSPDDRPERVRRKTELYLAHGATLVLNADPAERTVSVSTQDDERLLHTGDVIEHPAFPGLRLAVNDIFAPLDEELPPGQP